MAVDVELAGAGVVLAGTQAGEGRAVLLLHAGGERRAVWDPVIARLTPRRFRCVAVDQRGHGGSPPAGAHSLDHLTADVVALCEQLGGPVVVVGASLGGFAGLLAAAARPDLIAGLVMVDVVPDPDPVLVRSFLAETVVHGVVGGADPVLVEGILDRADELRAALAAVGAPVLLVRGARSATRDPGAARRFQALAPHAEIADIDGAGHLVARDRPVPLADTLAAFLERVDGRRPRAHALLIGRGAGDVEHLGGDLLTHLRATETLLRSWSVPEEVALAGLCHAVYGTDGFAPHLLELTERSHLRRVIGDDAEEIVHRYASCDRTVTYAGLGRQPLPFHDRFTGAPCTLTRAEGRSFALVTAANELDLVRRAVVTGDAAIAIARLVRRLVPYAPDVLGTVAAGDR